MKRAIFWQLGLAFLGLLVLVAILFRAALPPGIIFLIATLVALAIAYALAEEFTAPIEKLRDSFEQVRPQDYPVTELRDIAQKIDDLTSESRQASVVRRDFFANASHELKTPITSIKGSAELLCADIPLEPAQQKELLHRIGLEADRMHSLINDIIMINRLESGDVIGDREELDLAQIIRDCCDELSPLVEQNNLRLDLRLEPVILLENPKNVYEIISNLAINAVHYTPPGGLVDIRLCADESEVILTVRNDAEPISTEHQSRMFERFYRIDHGRSKAAGGTGLGLSIVKHAVESLGGTIGLESNEALGVLFTVHLPR